MHIEFHYYITYLIAARAGIRGDALRVLSYASQFTDDNQTVYPIRSGGREIIYRNRISQTLDPLKTHKERLEVYPLFHFIPGEPDFQGAARVDTWTHPFNTTPNSPNANQILDSTIATNDYYQIGIASHAYVDTWAHQNFVGFKDDFNKFAGFWDPLLPNIGHTDAKSKPDYPRLVWNDERLVAQEVNNKLRFLDAAIHLFAKLRKIAVPGESVEALEEGKRSLKEELDTAIGNDPDENEPTKNRLRGYDDLAAQNAYGATTLPKYEATAWFDAAIRTKHHRVGRSGHGGKRENLYYFRPDHEISDWFKFQNAVVAYADRTKTILCENSKIAEYYNA
jgi:hypothetical protein